MAHAMSEVVLRVSGLKVAYGGIQAVKGVDLEIRAGELVTLIGANGAGKTTTLKAITGTQAWSGAIEYLAGRRAAWPRMSCSTRGWRWCPRAAGCSRA